MPWSVAVDDSRESADAPWTALAVTQRRHAGRVADAVCDPPGTSVINSRIVASWRRCLHAHALDPGGRPAAVVIEQAELEARREGLRELMDIAQTEMTNLYEQIAATGCIVMLTDDQGVVLEQVGDPVAGSQASLRTGSVWSEQAQGTNGIGTCLVERRPLIVHRDEHFFTENTGLTCAAAPIFDPSGALVAVLNTTGLAPHPQQHTMVLVDMSAQLIEDRLFLRRMREHYIVRFHSRPEFIGTLGEGTLAVDREGRVRAANRSAVFQLDVTDAGRIIGKPVESLFALRAAELVDGAHRSPGARHPLLDTGQGRRFFASFQAPSTEHLPQARRDTAQTAPPCAPLLAELAFGDLRMRRNVDRAIRLIERDIPFILLGETGTGKDTFASAVHRSSERADGPFIAINCASLPEALIESELFGYRPGAFTGARREGARGKIVQSQGGTLFLDEIGDMPLPLQARLLRVLEERAVTPLGGETPVRVDFRLISATHRDLRQQVEEGGFREDLYYRLNGISLWMPPLREREDRRALICHLAEREAGGPEGIRLEDKALEALDRYAWPGNIRQLRNVLRTLIGLSDDGVIRLQDLPDEILRGAAHGRHAVGERTHNLLDCAERATLIAELEAAHWNLSRVAAKLNFSRNKLYRRMRHLDIQPPRRTRTTGSPARGRRPAHC